MMTGYVAYLCAIPGDAPAIRTNDIENHAHGGGFSCTIRPKEAKDRTFFDLHRQIFDDVQLIKRFINVFNDQSHSDDSLLWCVYQA